VDKICYTDLDIESGCHQKLPVRKKRVIQNDFYQMKIIKLDHLTPRRRNRFIKIMIPDEIFDNYEYSFYVDCKHPIVVDFEKYVDILNAADPPADFLARQHPRRGCLYDEAKFCLLRGKGEREDIFKQVAFYKKENFPIHNGLYAGYWLARRHTPRLKKFMKAWWEQILKYSDRDQISLPYVAWKQGISIPIYCRPRRPSVRK